MPDGNRLRDALSGPVFMFFILLFVYSKWGPAIPLNFTTQSRGEPMTVESVGKVVVTPDIAKVNLGIQESGSTLKLVQESVNKKTQALNKEFEKLGIKEKDIKTTSYNVYPQYDFTNPNSRITGYQVSVNYEVTVREIDNANDVLLVATNAGVNIVGGIAFDLSDDVKTKKTNEAREIAANLAKEKAKGLASAVGITLGKIINVSESQGVDFDRPIAMLEKVDSGPGGIPTPADIEPGQTEIAVTVTLSYEVR
ncbi:MAG: SIMPL domain-containing protein [Patescibacteria group bacterium]